MRGDPGPSGTRTGLRFAVIGAGMAGILAAIKRHDAESAKAAMRRHIEDVEEIVLDKFKR